MAEFADDEVVFRDFTKKRKIPRFKVDDDVFECVPALAPASLQSIVGIYRNADFSEAIKDHRYDEVMNGIRDVFGIFLVPESIKRFTERLSDRRNPIDVEQLLDILSWTIELYTKRPTVPSPNSSEQSLSGDGGTSSPAGARDIESTPWTLPLTGSSI